MLKVGRILRDYRDAGAVNELLAVWGFVDEGVFLTKAGHVGVVYPPARRRRRRPDARAASRPAPTGWKRRSASSTSGGGSTST